MEKSVNWVLEKKVERTLENLQKNNMQGFFVQDKAELLETIESLLSEGESVGAGGSITLLRTGVLDLLNNGKYDYIDRNEKGLTRDQVHQVWKKCLTVDTYLSSSNALTEEGELYNVDAYGNRVAAMMYGPSQVIIVVGINKLVENLEEAIQRVKRIVAPANSSRLKKKTPCATTGYCTDCESDDRICNNYVLIRKQAIKNRIKVIIINDELGY